MRGVNIFSRAWVLVIASTGLAYAANISVDTGASRRAIAPTVYGLVAAPEAQAARMGATAVRFGGNRFQRYNWKLSVTNTGGDEYFFRNYVVAVDGGATNYADQFISQARDAGYAVAVDMPLLGYVSKDGTSCGFSVAKYGIQTRTDLANVDCGNGILDGGAAISGHNGGVNWNDAGDPLDTSAVVDAGFTQEWVAHLVSLFGQGSDGGVRFYGLGNQPALWWETHRDVHPSPASYAEMKSLLEAYGRAVKDADPSAKTFGPSEWGWLAYFDSAAGDRATYSTDMVPFYLLTAALYEQQRGVRILDYLDLHAYPQGTGVVTGDTSAAVAAARLRSTRILWDSNYQAESWETCCYGGGFINLIPRMRDWVSGNYAGTKLAITSYAWGAPNHISGALAQADVLGIFGREGVEVAMLDTDIPMNALIEDAFKLYRNYDGQGAQFGSTSIAGATDDVVNVPAYAAFDGQGRVQVVVLNKNALVPQAANLSFAGVAPMGTYRIFGFDSTNRLGPLASGMVTNGTLSRILSPLSVELIEYAPVGGVSLDAGFDAGVDAGFDAGFDAGVDAGVDAGGFDAGPMDAGFDAGVPDSGPVPVVDAGTDAGPSDAGVVTDAGTGGEVPPRGCNCGSGESPSVLAMLALVLARSRRRWRLSRS